MSVYWIGSEDRFGPLKIGYTWADSPVQRLKALQTGSVAPLTCYGLVDGGHSLEARCHRHLADYRIRGEWFQREVALELLYELQCGEPPWEDDDGF